MTHPLEEVGARAMCEADPLAPDPDAPILLGMKDAKAWEARVPIFRAAFLAALRHPAMREPSKGVDSALWHATGSIHNAWRDGIDALAREVEEG